MKAPPANVSVLSVAMIGCRSQARKPPWSWNESCGKNDPAMPYVLFRINTYLNTDLARTTLLGVAEAVLSSQRRVFHPVGRLSESLCSWKPILTQPLRQNVPPGNTDAFFMERDNSLPRCEERCSDTNKVGEDRNSYPLGRMLLHLKQGLNPSTLPIQSQYSRKDGSNF
jgi:hypothetical protein